MGVVENMSDIRVPLADLAPGLKCSEKIAESDREEDQAPPAALVRLVDATGTDRTTQCVEMYVVVVVMIVLVNFPHTSSLCV